MKYLQSASPPGFTLDYYILPLPVDLDKRSIILYVSQRKLLPSRTNTRIAAQCTDMYPPKAPHAVEALVR